MKGILLAGGTGSRLYPTTLGHCKQLLPVYNKPLIYYPLSVLMLAGITDILIISTPQDLPIIQRLLGDGDQLGTKLSYQTQDEPSGIAHAFILGEEFLAGDQACLILGDNIFYGHGLMNLLIQAKYYFEKNDGALLFAYRVTAPKRYGIIEFNEKKEIVSIEEKPSKPKSNYAATGLYFYDNQVIKHAKQVIPSARGELEITCLNQIYLKEKKLRLQMLDRGFAWFDAGTAESLLEASNFIYSIEKRQGLKIACLEEIAWYKKLITTEQLLHQANTMKNSEYGQYLQNLVTSNQYLSTQPIWL